MKIKNAAVAGALILAFGSAQAVFAMGIRVKHIAFAAYLSFYAGLSLASAWQFSWTFDAYGGPSGNVVATFNGYQVADYVTGVSDINLVYTSRNGAIRYAYDYGYACPRVGSCQNGANIFFDASKNFFKISDSPDGSEAWDYLFMMVRQTNSLEVSFYSMGYTDDSTYGWLSESDILSVPSQSVASRWKLTEIASSPSPLTPVPEPETYAMMLAGLGLLGVFARRRKQNG